MKKVIVLFSVIFLGISWVAAQVSFQAVPQKKEVGLNEPIRIQFILVIKNKEVREIGAIKLPTFTNAQVLGRQIIQNQSYDNEETTIQYGIEVGLRAVKTGSLKIKEATIEVDGKTFTTQPFTITIAKSIDSQEEIAANSPRMGEAFLVLKISDKTPYQNEGIIAQLKLYTRSVGLLNSMTHLVPPNFQELFVQPIKERNNSYEEELINGEVYLSREVSSYVIFPSKPGVIIINPFTLTLTIPSGFFNEQEIHIKSAPIVLQVKKLPDNAPKDFYGVVGNYIIKAASNKKEVNKNEATTITIEVSGRGNIGLVKVPSLLVPEGIEEFIPKNRLESISSLEGVLGKATISTVLVPHRGGVFDIGVKPFSFFDPKEKIFKKLSIDPIILTVIEESVTPNKDNSNPFTINDSVKTESNIPDIKIEGIISDVLENKEKKSNKLIIILLVLIVIVTMTVIYFGFIKKRVPTQGKLERENIFDPKEKIKPNTFKLESKKVQKEDFISELFQLKKITDRGGDKKEFYTLLETILQKVIHQSLNISENQYITSLEIEEKLANKFGDEFSEECKNILLKTQIERYSNLSDKETLSSVYLKAEELIKKLN